MREYGDMEEEFRQTLSEFRATIECDCGHKFDTTIYYDGVVGGEERQMGAEKYHMWLNELDCLKCEETLRIECTVYEYPEGDISHVDCECMNCKILNKNEIYTQIGFKPVNS